MTRPPRGPRPPAGFAPSCPASFPRSKCGVRFHGWACRLEERVRAPKVGTCERFFIQSMAELSRLGRAFWTTARLRPTPASPACLAMRQPFLSAMTLCLRATSVLCLAWLAFVRPAEAEDAFFADRLQPFLQKYCIDCHSGDTPEADLAFDIVKDEGAIAANRAAGRTSSNISRQASCRRRISHSRLPRKWPASTPGSACGWRISTAPGVRDPGRGDDPPSESNRIQQYDPRPNGHRFSARRGFPSDDVGYGFDNIGDVLSMPPICWRNIWPRPRNSPARAIVDPWPPRPEVRTYTQAQLISGQRGRKGVGQRPLGDRR